MASRPILSTNPVPRRRNCAHRGRGVRFAWQYLVSGYEKVYEDRGHEDSEQGDIGNDVLQEEYAFDDLIEELFMVGDLDDLAGEITAYEDVLDVDHVVARAYVGGMEHDDVMCQLDLLCDDVAPRV